MKKPALKTRVMVAMIAVLMLVPVTAQAAQNPVSSQDHDSAAPKKLAKPSSFSGKIGPDGKTFTADKGGRIWHVSNPELVSGIGTLHVNVRALLDVTLSEIRIVSVTILSEPHSGINYGDAAFRR
jgi:hypothetical protein